MPTTTGSLALIPRNFSDVLQSISPNFQSLVKSGDPGIAIAITKIAIDFLTLNSTGDNIPAIARQFSDDVIETRPDWKIDDIYYFFKFIRQRQDLPECQIMGHRITPLKLMELVGVYEDYKSQERERQHKANRIIDNQDINPDKVSPEQVSENIKKILSSFKPQKEAIRPTLEKSDSEVLHNKLFAEFDALYIVSGLSINGVRFINLSGRKITAEEYVNEKMKM